MNTATPVMPKSEYPGDNVYMKMPPALSTSKGPQAYVPYSPPNQKSYGGPCLSFVARDTTMVPMSIVGMALTFVSGLPIGIFTGPSSLKRAKRVDELVQAGRRPRTDLSDVTTTRVCSWIGIALSVPLLLLWLLVLAGVVMVLAG